MMNSPGTSNEEKEKSLPSWTPQDDAEYNRLALEMNEDAKLQFTLFTFSITAATAVLGFLTRSMEGTNSTLSSGLPSGYLFLVPLVVLLPTSLMILNRARTRNRKAAYIVVSFDYKRLRSEGVTDQTPLDEVRQYPYLPWETALHILDRTNWEANRRVHLAPALKYMFISYFAIEIICIALAVYISRQAIWYMLVIMGLIVVSSIIPVYWFRIKVLIRLTRDISIQGFVKQWLILKPDKIGGAPQYLQIWIEEFEKTDQMKAFRS